MNVPDADLLLEKVAALKHDLAKYVAWRSVNYQPQAWGPPLDPELAQALVADILQTQGGQPAWVVWQRHASSLASFEILPELRDVEVAVTSLKGHEATLAAGDPRAIGSIADELREAQTLIRTKLRDLHRRLLRARANP